MTTGSDGRSGEARHVREGAPAPRGLLGSLA